MKHLLAVPVVFLSFNPLPATRYESAGSMCSVGFLRHQSGYHYTVPQIQQLVERAEVIVRAEAVDSFRVFRAFPPQPKDTPFLERFLGGHYEQIRFRTIEVLRWPDPAEVLLPFPDRFTLSGRVVDTDDFNPRPVPYGMVRMSGQRGSCYTSEYRIGGEYLFLFKDRDNALTPHWSPLGPTNEQIRGDDDPWLQWVREQAAQDA